MSWEKAITAFSRGRKGYLSGVATMNDPEFMRPIHAVPVETENQERIARWAYNNMIVGSCAMVKATLYDVDRKTSDDPEGAYRQACIRFGQWSPQIDELIKRGEFGEGVRRLTPNPFTDPETFSLLKSEVSLPPVDFMDGLGISPFFDGWEPNPVLRALGSGDVGGVEQIAFEFDRAAQAS